MENIYRSRAFQELIEAFYQSIRAMACPYTDTLQYLAEKDHLFHFDAFLKDKGLPGLLADDLFRLSVEPRKGGFHFCYAGNITAEVTHAVHFLVETQQAPSAACVLIDPPSDCEPFLIKLQLYNALGLFFTPDLWQFAPQELKKIAASDALTPEVRAAVEACLDKLADPPPRRSPYRDPELEEALLAFAVYKTGRKDGYKTKCILAEMVLAGSDELEELDSFVQAKIGRGLQADDLCLLAHNCGNLLDDDDYSVLTFTTVCNRLTSLLSFLTEKRSVFSGDALFIERKTFSLGRATPFEAIRRSGKLDALWDPTYWAIDPQKLIDLRTHVADPDIRNDIDTCLKQIDLLAPEKGATRKATGKAAAPTSPVPLPVSSRLTKAAVCGKNKKAPSPLVDAANWRRFREIQALLAAKKQALTWNDLLQSTLEDEPFLAVAIRHGAWDDVCACLAPPARKIETDLLLKADAPNASPAAIIARTGKLLPLLHLFGQSADDILTLADSLSPDLRTINALDSFALRHLWRKAHTLQPTPSKP
jgi:hypothetical protein